MFQPVGSQPPSVYWRRRLLVIGSLIIVLVLLVVTVHALASSGSGPTASGGGSPVADHTSSSSTRASSTSTPSTSTPRKSSRHTSAKHSGAQDSRGHGSPKSTAPTSSSGSTAATVGPCTAADLDVSAVVGHQSYRAGQDPVVGLQVTNVGSAPCAQDLADKQVVLKVYNGVSRVWGSHDCQTQPGTELRTLAVNTPVQVSMSWTGETSQPGCAGARQHVGAGTYTLYASLSGKTGTSARFTIS